MGESAGSAAVSALAVSPLTKELLHGAITMSGSANAGWAIHRLQGSSPQWDMVNIADYIRCNKLIADQVIRLKRIIYLCEYPLISTQGNYCSDLPLEGVIN